MSRRTSSCWPRPGSASASGSWSRSPWRRPRMRSGSARTGTGTRPPSRGPGSRRGRTCRRWRSPPMARGWRCARRRAAANAPRALNRWYACDITAGRDVTIGKIFDEADRRDPGHRRTWIALADGDICQLALIQAQAAARGITLVILIDFIHVLEYLWKAAWCFHAPRDPAMEDWVTAQGLDILHGRVRDVIARIRQLAEDHPPKPGGEHAKIIRKTLHYLDAKQSFMDYPQALAAGWPIATGVIEGACRHLVQDRMGITGARWSLQGAQAKVLARAIAARRRTGAYWDWHITREHQRNHLSRYQDNLGLAA